MMQASLRRKGKMGARAEKFALLRHTFFTIPFDDDAALRAHFVC